MPCVLHVSVTVNLIVFDIISLNKVFCRYLLENACVYGVEDVL